MVAGAVVGLTQPTNSIPSVNASPDVIAANLCFVSIFVSFDYFVVENPLAIGGSPSDVL
jgi:hypothetical protein